jgi:6-phosphofructokinase 1
MSDLEDNNPTTNSQTEARNPLIHDLNAEPETPIIVVDGKLVGNMLVGQSGGPTAVINASVAGVIQEAGKYPDQIVEIYGGLNGIFGILHENLIDLNEEKARSIEELKHTPGAALGTCRYKIRFNKDPEQAALDMNRLFEVFEAHNIRYFFYAGGNDSQDTNNKVHLEAEKRGYPLRCIGVPKTIDNDLSATDLTFGFTSAVEVATDALDRLNTTAESHDRVMLLEVMGRDAGWIALWAGVAGGADCIAIPEIPYDPDRFTAKIKERRMKGRHFTLIVVAEGARPMEGEKWPSEVQHGKGRIQTEGAASTLARLLTERMDVETRTTVLGHLQRGGSPVAFDRVLATQFGVRAVELILAGRWGEMVCLKGHEVDSVPIRDAVAAYRTVSPDHSLIATARAVGIEFGA